jgi:hypothetical protein
MHAGSLAAALEDLSTEQHTAAASHVEPEMYAAVRPLLPGVTYHAGAPQSLLTSPSHCVTHTLCVARLCGYQSLPDMRCSTPARVHEALLNRP